MDSFLINLLRCPESIQPLHPATPALIDSLNQRITSGNCLNQAGQRISQPLVAALLREDGRRLYPIRNGIPVMLAAESISLDVLN